MHFIDVMYTFITLIAGDALAKLQKLQQQMSNKNGTLFNAAKWMRDDATHCKSQHKNEDISISHESALQMIPHSFFNFCCAMIDGNICDAPLKATERVSVTKNTEQKAVIMAQQMLHHVTPINTPLSVGTSYYLYNRTRSKSLITLCNKLHVGISYDTLHRQLTSQCEEIIMKIEEEGVYIPQNINLNTRYPPVYPIDNLDWTKKTIEGGSFNATTSMIIQNLYEEDEQVNVSYNLSLQSSKHRTPTSTVNFDKTNFFVTPAERKRSKSLEGISSLDNLNTKGDDFADNLLLLWQLGRLQESNLWDTDDSHALPNFSAFCARMSQKQPASVLGYLPLIPESPTKAAVLKGVMENIGKINSTLGHEWTVIAGDQATYELASAIRKKEPAFKKVLLLLGGFHLAFNYLRAICKIIRDAGGEKLMNLAGLFSEGTARKAFGE
jgi:hypothetical protein